MSRRVRAMRLAAACVAAGLLAPLAPALAQGARPPEARLAGRLDDATRGLVLAQVDSARRDGLPFEKLVDRALEGASKRAPGSRIAVAVRDLRLALGQAREALGRDASPVEVEAGASAVQARVAPRVLAGLRRARPDGSLTVPLAVLTDLVAFGVPVDTAARTVIALARAEDAALVAYQHEVERDISVGAVPAAAASLRAGPLVRSLENAAVPTQNTGGLYSGDGRNTHATRPAPRKP